MKMNDLPYAEVLTQRSTLFESHPLLVGKLILDTPLLLSLLGVVKPVVLLRAPGCWMGAPSGSGKSSALTFLEYWLPRCSSRVQVVRYDAQTDHELAIRGFHQRMAKALGVKTLAGDHGLLRTRVSAAFEERARLLGKPTIVLLIDETQAMTQKEIYFLKDTANEFQQSSTAELITILVGQEPQMTPFIAKLKQTSRTADLASRFGLRRVPFPRYSTRDDFEGLFIAIDNAEFPEGSGFRWTQFFFPASWEKGFRLRHEIENFMTALVASTLHAGDGQTLGFPIREVMLAVRAFMVANAEEPNKPKEIPPTAWCDAVDFALVADTCKLIWTAPDALKVKS